MKAAGIVAEYDPFHAGHAWQIARARELGAQAVAVCMSADVTQRGGAALLPPAVRARAAACTAPASGVSAPNTRVSSSGTALSSATPAAAKPSAERQA